MHDALAAAGGYVDDAADALQESNVFVSPEVNGKSALESALLDEIGDASIGVAVFSTNAAIEATGPEILRELTSETTYDTIIVAVGNDLFAATGALDAGEALRMAIEAQSSANTPLAALTETVQTVIIEAEPAPMGVEGLVIAAAIGGAVILGGAIAFVASRRGKKTVDPTGEVPPRIGADLLTLRTVRGQYAALGAAGNYANAPTAAQTALDIDTIVDNVTQLFQRLGKKGLEGEYSRAEVEYGPKVAKLTTALDRDYLLDILTNPRLWDDPNDRVAEVRQAVVAVSNELLENIKQVNARRALHFQVSLDSLIGSRKELQDWEKDFRAAEGPTP